MFQFAFLSIQKLGYAEGGSHMATQHDKQFKLDAIQYYQDHKDLGVRGCAENLDIGPNSTLMFYKKIISRNRNLL